MQDRYVAAFRAFAGNGGAGAPAWLAEIRETALARFSEVGFPTTRQEEWRFTSVAPLVETPFALPVGRPPVAPSAQEVGRLLLGGARGGALVFVDGRFDERLSSLSGVPAGVKAGSLRAALAADEDLVREHLARHAGLDGSPFAALNTAFLEDGAFVYVPARAQVEVPIELLFLSTARATPQVSHPRALVVVDRQARVAIVESYAAVGEGVYWTNAVTEVVTLDGARADVYRVQRESERAYHTAATQSDQARDSVVWMHPVVFGAALSRHDIGAVLDGPDALCTLNGLYLLSGRQHVDHHTVIDHAKPHGESHEYFNGVLDDRAHGVFNGRIIVRKGAQRTDSKQTNNNLILSDEARADSQPQLEIYADDVKCTHGATLGPIDEKAMFYLLSRGLGREEARGVLTYGFGAEILARMGHGELREQLDRLVRARLDAGMGRRRAT